MNHRFSDTLNVVTEDYAVTFDTDHTQTLRWQSSQQRKMNIWDVRLLLTFPPLPRPDMFNWDKVRVCEAVVVVV